MTTQNFNNDEALASQFVITYILGMEQASSEYNNKALTMELFSFGHEVLDCLTRYKTKGAQLINVQYNHNQGLVNNFNVTKETPKQTIGVQ